MSVMSKTNRRRFLKTTATVATTVATTVALAALGFAGPATISIAAGLKPGRKFKIGVIGAGRIGGAVGGHWVRAGHTVLFSSRHPDRLKGLATELNQAVGPRASVGTPRQAAAFGEIVPRHVAQKLSQPADAFQIQVRDAELKVSFDVFDLSVECGHPPAHLRTLLRL